MHKTASADAETTAGAGDLPTGVLPLPLTVEGVTTSWLTDALRTRQPELTVSDAAIEDVLLGTSTKIRVRCRYAGVGASAMPPTLIVKGGFEAHSPSMKEMYANEARFYADIAPNIPINVPASHFAASDPASHQSIVIMEDLRRDGVVFCDALKPQRFDQVARRLEAMAAYHAATWQSPAFEAGGPWSDITGRFESWGRSYMDRYLVPEVWAHYIAAPRGAAVSTTLHDREWMAHALRRMGELQQAAPRCLIHGDTHLGNLYINERGEPGFFDAQVARASWDHEVAYHLVCAVDSADRARWEGALLDRYLRSLAGHGIAAPDFETAWLAYRQSIAWGLWVFLVNETRFQTEAVNTAYAARFSVAMIDHDVKRLLA